MHGSIWQWVEDRWNDGYNGAPIDGRAWIESGDAARRVLRGGYWDDSPVPVILPSSSRGWGLTVNRENVFGLRVGRMLRP
jgi:formylglycine-generating enzyme required for sulfatase activity